jgi:hypothetical protein
MLDYIDRDWGSGEIARRFAPSRQDDPTFRQWMGWVGSSGSVRAQPP